MAKITFSTDKWGGVPGVVHVELQWDHGRTLMVTMDGSRCHVGGELLAVDVHSMNALDIYPSDKAPEKGQSAAPLIRAGAHPYREEVERLKESRAAIARATGEAFREGEAKASARIRRELEAYLLGMEDDNAIVNGSPEHAIELLRSALDRIVSGE